MMKKTTMIVTAVLGAAVLMSSLAVAKPSQEQLIKKATQQQCKSERKADGEAFKEVYGPNAMRTCKKGDREEATVEVRSASQDCRAERSEDPDAFKEAYGTNENGKNAFGKCVSAAVKAENREDTAEFKNAAKACDAERDADEAAFNEAYGKNENDKNAFGKCVSTKEEYEEDSV